MFGRHLVITGPQQLRNIALRNLHLTGATYQAQQKATDPIQQLFVTKIREYAQKKKQLKAGEVLVDASPEVVQNYSDSLNRIYKMYSVTEATARIVPDIQFEDKTVQVIELDNVDMDNFTPEFPEDKIDLSADNPKNLDLNQRLFGYDPERNLHMDVPSKIQA
ncbi:ATP synthase-coupling factor 6, mitochondrial-like [Ostrea edulis]|uniref:ATP synthase-coupling factor 6, mitochondrial-like n=1 Tax=Ostrea edulis TaxID=37623 RepID=UPI00209587F4|nr:ATP synthase-coupling factor 6, mitochondrial-like [Ostrea edulis]XP_056011517.1 ATP synthase-coupling factor 6, mitochondrial-like [Ostrea edulis]